MNPISYLDISFGDAKFPVEVFTKIPKTAITSKGLGTLMEAITYMYGLISQSPQDVEILTKYLALKLVSIKASQFSEDEFILIRDKGQLIGINPRFEYNFYDAFNRIIISNKSFSWPKYGNTGIRTIPLKISEKARKSGICVQDKESYRIQGSIKENAGGIIRFTPEFNIDTNFDNANFYRAQNDNFTEKIFQFVNAPAFNKSLFILRKLHCGKNPKIIHATTANNLQLLVIDIYQIALQIQNNQISWETGFTYIIEAIESYDKYLVYGARSVFYMNIQNNLFFLQFINRYNLPKSDCVVAFTLDGVIDFTNDKVNDLILSVSEVPVDEDMSDAVYSPILGIFAYGNI